MQRLEREGKELELGPKEDANKARAMRRAKSAIRDLVRSNTWDYFVTLTLDAQRVDRYDMGQVVRRLNRWADNQVRRHGLAYVLVPELHKDGAIHFHGFFAGGPEGTDSGTLTMPGHRPRKPRSAAERRRLLAAGWQVVYNLPAWDLGFTTAIRPYGDQDAAAAYITKYITKAAHTTGKIGGRWYYSGGALLRPTVTYGEGDPDTAAAVPGAWEGTIQGLGARLVIYRTDANVCPINGTASPENGENRGGKPHDEMGKREVGHDDRMDD